MARITADDIVTEVKSSKGATIQSLLAIDPSMRREVTQAIKQAVREGAIKLGKGGQVSFVKNTAGMNKLNAEREARTQQNIAKLKVERQREKELFKAMDDLNKFAKKNPGAVKAIAKEKSAGSDFRARSKASLQKGGERAKAVKEAQSKKEYARYRLDRIKEGQQRANKLVRDFKPHHLAQGKDAMSALRAASGGKDLLGKSMSADHREILRDKANRSFKELGGRGAVEKMIGAQNLRDRSKAFLQKGGARSGAAKAASPAAQDFRARSKAQLSKPAAKPNAQPKPAAPTSAHSAQDFRSRAKSMFQNPSSSGGKNAQLAAEARKLGHQVLKNDAKYGPVMKGPKGGSYVIYNGKKYYGNY